MCRSWVAIESIASATGCWRQGKVAGGGEIQVQPAVAIVVEHRDAAAVGRRVELLRTVPLQWTKSIPEAAEPSRNRIVTGRREPTPGWSSCAGERKGARAQSRGRLCGAERRRSPGSDPRSQRTNGVGCVASRPALTTTATRRARHAYNGFLKPMGEHLFMMEEPEARPCRFGTWRRTWLDDIGLAPIPLGLCVVPEAPVGQAQTV